MTPLETYMVGYNGASAAAWFIVLFFTYIHMSQSTDLPSLLYYASRTFTVLGPLVQTTQTFALFDVLHSLLGFVKSSPATVASQVFSRFVVVWYISKFYPNVPNTPFYTSMIVAWCLSEITRYIHYILLIRKIKSPVVEWARYSLFYVLYPIGAGSEWMLIYKALPEAKEQFGVLGYALNLAFLVIWPPSLAFLMSHLHRQRRKHIRGVGAGKKRA